MLKLIKNDDKNKDNITHKKISFGKACIVILIIFIATMILARYVADKEFRQYVDTNILQKEVSSENLNTIDINSENNPTICAIDNHIAVLSKSILEFYDTNAKLVNKIDINLASPITASCGSHLILAENSGNKIYAIKSTNLAWQTQVSGTITRINVNKNGYVSVIVSNTSYKSLVIVFDNDGNEIFKTYLAKTFATCTDISQDNKYLAIGEVDYSGTIIKSTVKIVSTDSAIKDSANAIVYQYNSDADEIITNIKYSDKQNAICMFNSYIQNVSPTGDTRVFDVNQDTIFMDCNLEGNLILVEKQSSGLFSYDYQMKIISTLGAKSNLFILSNSMPKNIDVAGKNICINYGNEVQFVNDNGWLIKRYTPHSEIKDIVLADGIAGIIYKDEIDVIKL